VFTQYGAPKKCTLVFDNDTTNQTGADMIIFRFGIVQTCN